MQNTATAGIVSYKQAILTFWLADIEPVVIEITPEIEAYADALIKEGILTPKSHDDCLHIACAVINKCDMILLWNFKYMVRIKTVDDVKIISERLRYDKMRIYPPSMLVERSEDDE